MNVCVVGGTGNISRSIVHELLKAGHAVTCCTRGQSGCVPEGARAIVVDRTDREPFEATMRREQFEAAIDMIAFTAEDAASSLRAFRGVSHFVHCSTVCTYGLEYDWIPVSEDHPLRPVTPYGIQKAAADAAYLAAYHRDGFPVTIVKPSTTYGPRMGLLRQIAWEFGWIDRVRKGKPILICGDGHALHQFLHVHDAGKGFAGIVGRERTIGQVYNLVNRGFTSWRTYHTTAMQVLGREVELIGIPLAALKAMGAPNIGICETIFAHNAVYASDKIFRDVPEFTPTVGLAEGMAQVLQAMDRERRVPDSDADIWEDRVIDAIRGLLNRI